MFTSVPLQTLIDRITEALVRTLANEPATKHKDQLLTRQQTAKVLQVSLPTLNLWTKRGIIQAKRINSRVRYSEADVFAALQNYNKYRRAAV